jgi:ABC-type proline/glycine betaine transport system permease subunit
MASRNSGTVSRVSGAELGDIAPTPNTVGIFPATLALTVAHRTESEIMDLELESLWLLGALAVFTLVVNLPFGFMRARAERYSLSWILYIHLPIPLIYLLRRLLMFSVAVIPALVVAAVVGQICGGKIRTLKQG